MNLETVTEALRQRVGNDSGLNATVKFDFGPDGVIFVDGASTPNTVSNEDREAACTIAISLDDFKSMSLGEIDPATAFMMGKLKVSGDMGIAMRLSSVLG